MKPDREVTVSGNQRLETCHVELMRQSSNEVIEKREESRVHGHMAVLL